MNFTLKQLQYAVALAETGHFGRAAERCFVTQPALSQQVRQLETECGTDLFDRLGKSVRVTPFGREFIARALRLVEDAEALRAYAEGAAGQPSRPLRFGLIPTVAPYLLPEIFPMLRRDLPEITFAVSESRTEALLAGLTDGTLDLALIATEPPSGGPKLSLSPLFEDDFVLATAEAEGATGPVRLADIDTSRMLLLDEGHCFRDQALAACGLGAGTAPKTFAATSLSTIVEFVANGQGVTLLPQIALRKETASGRIAINRLQSPGAARKLQLCWREASPLGPLFERIAELIRAARPPQGE
jgi:LysR family hydrogen peroxide-inducible transcriptional activator